jgi:hypothetical protein
LEQSRPLLEKQGLRIAAVSYDSVETLRNFAEKYQIRYPLLSDADSAVIRAFGLFNDNIAPGLRAYGVPHPVEYLIDPDGTIVRKYFVNNYQHRVAASAVVLREFGVADGSAPVVMLQSGALNIQIGLASAKAFAGQEVGFFARFALDPGWHVYGAPLPDAYTSTAVVFNDPKVVRQSFTLPQAQPLEFPLLGETLPVYEGQFQGLGTVLLKFPLDAGPTVLAGEVRFQQCSATVCEPPETIPFEIAMTLEPFMVATPQR